MKIPYGLIDKPEAEAIKILKEDFKRWNGSEPGPEDVAEIERAVRERDWKD